MAGVHHPGTYIVHNMQVLNTQTGDHGKQYTWKQLLTPCLPTKPFGWLNLERLPPGNYIHQLHL